MTNDKLKEMLCDYGHPESLILSEEYYADAAIGMSHDGRIVYSYDKLIECYMVANECSYEDAMEWIDYNTVRSLEYQPGPGMPIIMYDFIEGFDVEDYEERI